MKALVSGFGPFGAVVDNVSAAVLPLLREQPPEGVTVETVELPVTFGEGARVLLGRIAALQPDVVIALGVAEDRRLITPELVAINHIHARIPDTSGARPFDEPIRRDAPFAYRATIPVYEVEATIRALGLPAAVSYSAGSYVCNHVLFELLHAGARSGESGAPFRGGFIHLPGAPADDAARRRAKLPTVADMAEAVRHALAVCVG